jgi:hypothetical protein
MASSPEKNPIALPVATDRKSGKDRRTQPGERIKPMFEPGKFLSETGADLTARQIDFGKAMDAYMRKNRRPHPTYSQILDMIDSMGYRLVAPAVALPGFGG